MDPMGNEPKKPPFSSLFSNTSHIFVQNAGPGTDFTGSNGNKTHVSNEKNLGCFWYLGDYTTQLYRDHNKPL